MKAAKNKRISVWRSKFRTYLQKRKPSFDSANVPNEFPFVPETAKPGDIASCDCFQNCYGNPATDCDIEFIKYDEFKEKDQEKVP